MEKMGGNMDRETRNTGRDNTVTGGILGEARSWRGLGPSAFCGGGGRRKGKKNNRNWST